MLDHEKILKYADALLLSRDQFAALPSQDPTTRAAMEALVAVLNQLLFPPAQPTLPGVG